MLVPQQIPFHIATAGGELSKGQKTFNSNIQKIEKLRTNLAAWDAARTAYHEKYTRELMPLVAASMTLHVTLVHSLDRISGEKGFSKSERRMLGEAIKRINSNSSVTSLFEFKGGRTS